MGKYRDYAPALKYGHKIYPQDIAGMVGLPSIGDIWYVDPGKTSGVSGNGTSREDAFLTVAEGYAAATADQDDVVLITPSSSTGRTAEVAAINWAKRRTHLIGSTAPLGSNPRAGMEFSSAVVSPCFTVSTRSCIFKNITILTLADINVLVYISSGGSYNYFEGVHFAGIGNETAGNDTAARCVHLSGAEENTFVRCRFGLDTVMRTGANYTLDLDNSSARNEFIGCHFTMIGDADAPRHVYTDNGGSGIDRYALFENCIFNDNSDVQGITLQGDVMQLDTAGDQGGAIILKDCMMIASTGWANDATGIRILGHASNDTMTTRYCGGIAANT